MNKWIDEKPYEVYTILCFSMKRSLMNRWIHCFAYNQFDCYIHEIRNSKFDRKLFPFEYRGLLSWSEKKVCFSRIHSHFQIKQEQKTDLIFDPYLMRAIRKLRTFQLLTSPKFWQRLLTNHDHSHSHGMWMRASAQRRSSNFQILMNNYYLALYLSIDQWNVSKSYTSKEWLYEYVWIRDEKPLVTLYSALSTDWLMYSGFWFVFVCNAQCLMKQSWLLIVLFAESIYISVHSEWNKEIIPKTFSNFALSNWTFRSVSQMRHTSHAHNMLNIQRNWYLIFEILLTLYLRLFSLSLTPLFNL